MLGGHSLLEHNSFRRYAARSNVELGLRTLFRSPTIEQLSLEVERLVVAQIEAMSEEEVNQLLG